MEVQVDTFAKFDDEAPVWIFASSRELAPEEKERVSAAAREFVGMWKSHGEPLRGDAVVVDGRFLIVGVDGDASGCSVDKLYDFVRQVERHTGAEFLNPGLVHFRSADGSIRSVDRPTFRELASRGEVGAETEVFDPSLSTVGEFRQAWPSRASERWHRQYLA
jgi:hypothetical protein